MEVGDQRTQFWKRAIQIPFYQSLVAIGPVVSEEKIKVYDVRRTPSDGKSSHGLWPGEVKSVHDVSIRFFFILRTDNIILSVEP